MTLGPIPDTEVAGRHAGAVRDILETGDDLNHWSVYQPIRYAVEFGNRLTVLGLEDPELYDDDVATLDRIVEVHRALRRPDWTSGPTEAELVSDEARLRARIRSH